jgi:hypothetical protein
MALERDVASINELIDALEEESISRLTLDKDKVAFSITAPGEGVHNLVLRLDDASLYPASKGSVTWKGRARRGAPHFGAVNAKLEDGCSVGRTIALVGRQLGVDLAWLVQDASRGDIDVDRGSSECSEDGEEFDQDDSYMDDEHYAFDSNFDNEVLRAWSMRVQR